LIGYVVGLMEHELDVYRRYAHTRLRETTSPIVEVLAESEDDRLAAQYNRGIDQMLSRFGAVLETIVFLHPDVIILQMDFEGELQRAFRDHPDVGLIGFIGATYVAADGAWWSASPEALRGHIIQEYEGRGPRHLTTGILGFHDDLLSVDGLCFAIRGALLAAGLRFDERFPNYLQSETDVCFSVIERGYKVAVIDALMQHRSEGKRAHTPAWKAACRTLFDKWMGDADWDRPIHAGDLRQRGR
jgi:hypothetical protein